MPVCSYLVIPRPGAADTLVEQLRALPGCEALRAENRDVILLVTDTDGDAQEEQLRVRMEQLDGMLARVLTFGDLNDDAAAAGRAAGGQT